MLAVPLNAWRVVGRDVNIGGYALKKGTVVIPQISVLLTDENYFESPAAFRPERFLDADGKVQRADELCPFSIGARRCAGESLARVELFSVFCNILQRYKVRRQLWRANIC